MPKHTVILTVSVVIECNEDEIDDVISDLDYQFVQDGTELSTEILEMEYVPE